MYMHQKAKVVYRGVASPLSTSCNNLYLCVSMAFWPPYWGCSRHSGGAETTV